MVAQLPLGSDHTEIIDEVPAEIVGRVAQDFSDSGAVEVEAEPNPDGTWRVKATFRDG